jgi:lipopolysaccharide/colanic/teichoic acid biosynthesis glycosyltransferase
MSLVGPRPAISYEVELYEPWHAKRLAVKPGLSGYWQVMARSSVTFDEMAQLDIEYIEKKSIWLDLMIILKTPFIVLTGKGAE